MATEEHENVEEQEESAARTAVWAKWEGRTASEPPPKRRRWFRASWQDEVLPGETGDEDGYVAPRHRSAFPPSFLALCAAGAAFLSIEPTVDLSYTLFGSATIVDLGKPGHFHLDAARDGAAASIGGYAYAERGTYSQYLTEYEVFALTSVPVLVRRSPHPHPAPDSAEIFEGKGRLIRLDDGEASYVDRLLRPEARFAALREQFQAIGQLPFGRPCWLLLDGDLPRSHPMPIVLPFVLWAASLLFAIGAWRSHRHRLRKLPGTVHVHPPS